MKKLKSFLRKGRGEQEAEAPTQRASEGSDGCDVRESGQEGVQRKNQAHSSSLRQVPKDPAHKPQDPDVPAWCMEDDERPDPRQSGKELSAANGRSPGKRMPADSEGLHRRGPNVAPSQTNSTGPECVVCQGSGRGAWRALPCAHSFHAACLERWLSTRSSCPVCRMTFQFGEDGNLQQTQAARSTAVVQSNGELAAMHEFQQILDPNNLARAVVPRTLHNFLDRLPTPERFEAEGLYTLVPPTQQLLTEVQEDIGDGFTRLLGGPTQGRLRGPALLAIEAGAHSAAVEQSGAAANLGEKLLLIADADAAAPRSAAAAGAGGAGGRVSERVRRLEAEEVGNPYARSRGDGVAGVGGGKRESSHRPRAARPVMPGAENAGRVGEDVAEEVTVSV